MSTSENIKTAVALNIASVCHDANKRFCATLGDLSQPYWIDAPQWQCDSALAGVLFRMDNPDAGPSAQHESWMLQKQADGWVYGPVKDEMQKTHPCMVPYAQLPDEQKTKDKLFQNIVDAILFYTPYNKNRNPFNFEVVDEQSAI